MTPRPDSFEALMNKPKTFKELVEALEKRAQSVLRDNYDYMSQQEIRFMQHRDCLSLAALIAELHAAEESKRQAEQQELERLRWTALAQLGQIFSEDFKERLQKIEEQLKGEKPNANTEA